MDSFEEQLKNALRREPPAAGFSDRTVALIAAQARTRRKRWFEFPRLRWAVAVLLCAGLIGGFAYWRDTDQRARGAVAKQQAIVALRLAGAKIQLAESKVRNLSE